MEHEVAERVGSKRRRTRPKPRKSFAESPFPSQPKRRAPRRSLNPEAEEDIAYPIKGIVAEESRRDGKIWYKIDWEENSQTGEEPAENVTPEAIADWEQTKSRKQSEIEDSQPIRSAKRKRSLETYIPESPEAGAKKPRRAGTAETARFQSVSVSQSQDTLDSQGAPSEIKDSYEDDPISILGNYREAQVVIRQDQNFPRGAYPLVPSSQPSQSSQLLESQFTQGANSSAFASPQSRFKTPIQPRQFIWDEDLESVPTSRRPFISDDDISGIVPDSQEPNSSSYKASETQLSKEDFQTQPETARDTLVDPQSSISSRTNRRSSLDEIGDSTSQLHHPESSSHLSRSTHWEDSEPIPALAGSSTQSHSTRRLLEVTQERSQDTSSSSNRYSEGFGQAGTLSAPLELPLSLEIELSPRQQLDSLPGVEETSSTVFAPPSQLEEYPPDGQPPTEDQSQAQESQEFPSSFPFQTQVPFFARGGNSTAPEISESSTKSRNRFSNGPTAPYPEPPIREAEEVPSGTSGLGSGRRQPSVVEESLDGSASTLDHPDVNRHRYHATNPASSPEETELQSQHTIFESIEGQDLNNLIPSVERASNIPSSIHAPRDSSPLDSEAMDNQYIYGNPPIDTRQIIKQARANASAKRAAEQAASRDASTVPPSPAPIAPSQMLPLREGVMQVSVPIPAMESSPSPKALCEDEVADKSLRILPLGPNEFVVPLPMVSHTRDIYVQTIKNYKKQRMAFVVEDDIDTNLTQDIDLMIEELQKLCVHLDLISDDFSTQRAEPVEHQAKYAETVSTKCIFIAELIEGLVRSGAVDQHIAIFSQPGRMQEILGALILRYGFEKRTGNLYTTSRSALKISLLAYGSGGDGLVESVSAVVAFDSPRESGALLHTFQLRSRRPVISLIVTHSVEHLELCFPPSSVRSLSTERKRVLVSVLSQMQEEVGRLGSDYPSPPKAAQGVADFLVSLGTRTRTETSSEGTATAAAISTSSAGIDQPGAGTGTPWPVPAMPEILGIELDLSPQTEHPFPAPPPPALALELAPAPSEGHLSIFTAQPNAMSSWTPLVSSPSTSKRQLGNDDEPEADSSKRQRLALSSGEQKVYSMQEEHEPTISSLLSKIHELEEVLKSKEVAEAELHEQNQNLEAACLDYEAGVQAIQPKYQAALNDRGEFEYKMSESIHRVTALQTKLERQISENAKLREKTEKTESELAVSRSSLLASSIPAVAELQKAKDETRSIEAENAQLQKRYNNLQNDMEFVRKQYQEASSASVTLASELEEAQKKNAELETKASENLAQIHKLHHTNEIKHHLDHIDQLTRENEELQRELEKRAEELKAVTNGRRQTRGTSVPRSPRMGVGTHAMSPVRPVGRIIGNGSRGNSPAPGDAPMRSQFAEALFQGSAGNGRWANHLQ